MTLSAVSAVAYITIVRTSSSAIADEPARRAASRQTKNFLKIVIRVIPRVEGRRRGSHASERAPRRQ